MLLRRSKFVVSSPSRIRLWFGCLRVLNPSRSSGARDTSDVTSTRDELADRAGLVPRLAVAADQVVHGVGKVCEGEGDCFQPLGLVFGVDLADHLADEADHLGERIRDVEGLGLCCRAKEWAPCICQSSASLH
jgi:hypothetical protein